MIKHPGAHPHYGFEAEPHFLLGFVDAPGHAHGNGFGVGFRGTVQIVENGFVSTINNSVGIGFGADFVHYGYAYRDCVDFDAGGRCIRTDDYASVDNVYFPVVLQWNFWLSRSWSVFGEPGFAIRYESHNYDHGMHFDPFVLYLGGRYHFTDTVALTMRLGYPTFSIGVSFLL